MAGAIRSVNARIINIGDKAPAAPKRVVDLKVSRKIIYAIGHRACLAGPHAVATGMVVV